MRTGRLNPCAQHLSVPLFYTHTHTHFYSTPPLQNHHLPPPPSNLFEPPSTFSSALLCSPKSNSCLYFCSHILPPLPSTSLCAFCLQCHWAFIERTPPTVKPHVQLKWYTGNIIRKFKKSCHWVGTVKSCMIPWYTHWISAFRSLLTGLDEYYGSASGL